MKPELASPNMKMSDVDEEISIDPRQSMYRTGNRARMRYKKYLPWNRRQWIWLQKLVPLVTQEGGMTTRARIESPATSCRRKQIRQNY